jgi:glycosyltransferase involved in cell wall biosynthesis
MTAPLRVNFLLHAAGKTGGVLVVFEYARRLRKMGHDVRVYHPVLPYAVYYDAYPAWKRPLARVYAAGRNLLTARAVRRLAGDADVRLVPRLSRAFVRDADVTVATAWPTAYDAAALPASKGRKLYFIQGYEVWNGRVDAVDASYRLPLDLLTIAPWLTRLMREKFGREPAAEVRNGVDLGFFAPPSSRPAAPITILMMVHPSPVKGTADGLEVLRRVQEAHPRARLRLFGMHDFVAPRGVEYVRDPARDELLRLYQEADIFLSPSLSEGWGLAVVEAAACGCAVVATRTGCVPLLEESEGVLACEPGDRDALFRNLDALIRAPDRLKRLASGARSAVAGYGWEASAKVLEGALVGLAKA